MGVHEHRETVIGNRSSDGIMIFKNIFPSRWSLFIFIAYMALFVNQGILITASKTVTNTYSYSTVMVVLLTECLKLIVSTVCYLKDHSVTTFMKEIYSQKKIMLFYFIPAGLYCLYNNLQFLNLESYDPTSYYVLLQLRVVITGFMFQIVFGKKLTRIQWLSLAFLAVGCFVKEMNPNIHHKESESFVKEVGKFHIPVIQYHTILILLQVLSSCFAGVYTEYLLKDKACDVHIMIQNIFMYIDSVLCCIVALSSTEGLLKAFTHQSLDSLLQPIVIAIIFNSTAIGFVVSFFLQSLNSIMKNFASALEVAFTAILCWPIFGIPIDLATFVSICIVFIASYIYAKNPVVNKNKCLLPAP